MEWIAEAFQRKWFYTGALVAGVLYGYGGLVHIGNILGLGEMKWGESPWTWRIGDIWWGTLDFVAVVGIAVKSPLGLVAIVLAAGSQVVAYGLVPESFAMTEAHRSALRRLVYFNAVVLVVLAIGLYTATHSKGT